MAEIRQLDDHKRQAPGHIVVIQIENLQILEQRELRGECTVNNIVRDVEAFKRRYGRDLRRNRAGNLIIRDGKIGEESKIGKVRRQSTGEVHPGEVEADDMPAGIAGDARPGAVGGGGVPSGERGSGIIGNGALLGEKRAVFGEVSRNGVVEMEVKKEKEKQKKKRHFNGGQWLSLVWPMDLKKR